MTTTVPESTAQDIMKTDLITVKDTDPLFSVLETIETNGVRHLLVTDNDEELVGVISDRDLRNVKALNDYFNSLEDEPSPRFTAQEIMSRDIVTVQVATPIKELCGLMYHNRINAVPVFDAGRLAGIVTSHDVLKLIAGE